MAEEKPTGETEATTDEPKGEPGKTFTQDQVNDLLARQKGDVQRKFSDYDTLKDKASKLDEMEAASQSEVEKLTSKLAKAEERASTAEGRLVRFQVATEKKLPAELVERLQGSTPEELAADADKLLELVKPGEQPPPEFDGGTREPAPEPKSPEQQANEFAAALLTGQPTSQ